MFTSLPIKVGRCAYLENELNGGAGAAVCQQLHEPAMEGRHTAVASRQPRASVGGRLHEALEDVVAPLAAGGCPHELNQAAGVTYESPGFRIRGDTRLHDVL